MPGLSKEDRDRPRRAWYPMKLTYVGRIDQVLQVGGGKLSVPGGDPGEPLKQRPSG